MHYRFLSEIPKDEFVLIEQIGSGTFSDIFSATHLKTNTNVALKIFLKNNSQEYDKSIDQEVKINKSLHHPFICKFFTEFETEHLNIIAMELVEGMTLLDYVNQTHGLPPPEVSNFFAQLLIAIEYLHNEAHITHRDLKLENIMIDDSGHLRLIDFGFSTKNSLMSTLCGSIPYCAPEVLTGQLYTKASDIWSMGIILYALFDGNLPFFHHNTNILVSLICNHELTFPNTFDGALKDLLFRLLNKDPEQRIKIDEIKQHPFVSHEKLLQIDYKQLFNPTEKPHEQIQHSMTEQAIPEDTKKLSSSNLTNSQVKKSGFFRLTNSTFNLSNEALEILHEKITLKTDDIDLSIENRKNFAHNLTKLIESAFFKHMCMCEMEAAAGGTSLSSMIDNQLSLSSSQVIIQNSPLISLSLNHPGTSDNLGSFVNGGKNNHHYALTNHFAGLKNAKKPPCPNPTQKQGNTNSNGEKTAGKPPHPIQINKQQQQQQNQQQQQQQSQLGANPAAEDSCSSLINLSARSQQNAPMPSLPAVSTNTVSFGGVNGETKKIQQPSGKIVLPKGAKQPALHPLVAGNSGPILNDPNLVPTKRQNFNVSSAVVKAPGFSNPRFIAKTHRRHSQSRALGIPAPIISPLIAHPPTINLSEE